MKNKIRIAIVGVGGVGGYLGARLAATYRNNQDIEINFIQRGEHLKAIQENGLTLVTQHHTYKARPDVATDHPETVGELTHIIFCVKSYDLEESALSVISKVGSDTILISTLNGVDIEKRLSKRFPHSRILPGCIYVSAHIEKPGVIRQIGGAGHFFFGPPDGDTSGFVAFEKILQDARIKAKLDANIIQRIWEKYVFVSSIASVTSYYRVPVGMIAENEAMKKLFVGVIREIGAIAKSTGVGIKESIVEDIFQRISIIPYETKTSRDKNIDATGF